MASNLTDIHAIRLYDPVASKRQHRLKRPFVIYEEPLEPTIFVQPENPTATFNPTAEMQAPFTGAPPFAPGGPLNPYPASAGMAPPSASTYGDLPTNIPGQPGFDPNAAVIYEVPQGPGLASVGGYGSFTPPATAVMQPPPVKTSRQTPGRLPGKQPGQFQPGGGQPKMPNQPPMQRMQQPPMQPNPLPVPQPPFQQPGQLPAGGQTGAKPRGYRTLPMPERFHPPAEPPQPPGQWVTVDAGRGQPPAYGFLTLREEVESGVDTGLEGRPSHTGGARSEPYGSTSKASGAKSGEKGHYVPILFTGTPDADMEPTWVWIPEIDAEYGVRKRDKDDEPRVNPLGK